MVQYILYKQDVNYMRMESQEDSRELQGCDGWMGVRDATPGAPGCVGGGESGVDESWAEGNWMDGVS